MAAPSTAAARIVASADKPDLCGFCRFPSLSHPPGTAHKHCPRAIRNGPTAETKLILCDCTAPGCGAQVLRCTYCKTEEPGAVDPNEWACKDPTACRTRIETRNRSNPLWLHLVEIKEKAMARVAQEKAEKAEKAPKTAKVGECVHCGEATKGGKFLPGHDAAYVSGLVAATMATPKAEDGNRKKAYAASDSLGKKFDKSLSLAQERETKKAAAAEERKTAKEAAAAEKASKPAKEKAPA